ncbi:ribonuclease J [Aerococcus sanguinicola]|uniref:Ribonuclease J n=1 Tax=Aerococcus sanguinicola TaxID=119206 RepID=A0A2I1MNH7_9LACT|nr:MULTISPECIES: ribonuclease J [Aerococcus]MDK7050806.1 ribonuclease J [Aerococcus sanguinicola]OFT97978.1 RNase J family beta-CASP ribonuclease [Aerococcus sp. HMSC23C02]PKZ21686.1 ribonuclease J [Aerococcus sanguinicola]
MSEIKFISLGGVRENGKDMYIVEVDGMIYILDCGLVYPPNEMLGIDVMIPDFSYLKENEDRIAGVFLTHGHPDAIGGLPYLLKEVNVPVFGTELTIELLKVMSRSVGVKNFKDFHTIDDDNEIDFGDVVVSFIKTTHSLPDSVAIVLKTSEGDIVYTGDFKMDASVSEDYATDFARLTQVAGEGVLALLSESSKAASYFENASEVVVKESLQDEVVKAEGRVIVSAVASNLMRLQQIIDVAQSTGRHIFISGEALEQIIDVAIRLDKLKLPSKDLIKRTEQLGNYKDEEIIILETGKSGEPLYALQRMAKARGNKQLKIKEGDLVILATTPNTDMEKVVPETKDMVYRAGGHTLELSSKYHTSGHASPKDLQFLMSILKPQYLIPVSGEYQLMHAHKKLAEQIGFKENQIFLLDKGDTLTYKKGKMTLGDKVPASNVLIDGSGVGDIGNIVLRDRTMLGEDGIFVVVLTISRREGKILAGPEIISRGFIFMKESEDLLKESSERVRKVVLDNLEDKNFQWSKLKSGIRDELGKFLFKQTNRRPMILPVIMEASNYRKGRKKKGGKKG